MVFKVNVFQEVPVKILYVSLVSPILTTCLARNLHHFTVVIILDNLYKP